jgi:hypothetical protein
MSTDRSAVTHPVAADPVAAHPDDVRDQTDALPEDLDAADYVGPYLFPDNNRRRWPGALYLVTGVALAVGYGTRSADSVSFNRGTLFAALFLLVLGAYHVVAGAKLNILEVDALASASRAVGFPVGHASAQLGWRGLLSRPTWRILLYSAEEPPRTRGVALVDGIDASVVAHHVEDNPEDWSVFEDGGKLTAS